MTPKYIAFFDLDGTILSENSGRILIKECYRKGVMSRLEILKAVWLSILYKMGFKSDKSTSLSMIKWLKGTEAKFMQDFTHKMTDDILVSFIRPEILEEIRIHRNNGGKIVLLSAALTFIVKPIAEFLNFDEYICTDPEVKNGYFTGLPNGSVCIEDEKEKHIRGYCQEHGADLSQSWFYGDSWADRFAMQTVGHPIAVQPDRQLLKHSSQNGWTVIA